jgi:ATP adenylyltransferase
MTDDPVPPGNSSADQPGGPSAGETGLPLDQPAGSAAGDAGDRPAEQSGGSPYEPEEFVERDGVGVPDPFLRLWTPHRMAYIAGENKPTSTEAGSGCPFCRIPGLPDADGLIVQRADAAYAVLNLYPYNPGHLMIVPYRHVADYTELTAAEVADVSRLTQQAMQAVRIVSAAHGFNIGMNQGEIAGAGIAAHLHQHVVPRWGGDTNFMPVVAQTKVLPQLLSDTRALLAKSWPTD